MEPMLPSKLDKELEDLAFKLISRSNILTNQLHKITLETIGDLVRSMNCYYSNLIEGHNTHPVDIERALNGDYSQNIEKRNLQLEAFAHIEVQRLIDNNLLEDAHLGTVAKPASIISADYISLIHRHFYERLPKELQWVEDPKTKKKLKVNPGKFRQRDVQVGAHIACSADKLPLFISRFEEAYDLNKLSKLQQLIAVGAAHHRLLWIHPFLDGNGRVARLFSHAFLRNLGIGNSLWSVSRGLARRATDYKRLLMEADALRKGDLDGRGNLSERALVDFCKFFLEISIDQIDFMAKLLNLNSLLERVSDHINLEVQKGHLSKGSYALLKEALITGSFERGQAAELTGYKERQARTVLSTLLSKGLLYSEHSRSKVKIAFPVSILDKWFPGLY
ncbi:MAG: Fic family protein [Cyanobacteria bacterium REEB446]|nr:Fic family protein [Cyanobacteria bacterium REEB446]